MEIYKLDDASIKDVLAECRTNEYATAVKMIEEGSINIDYIICTDSQYACLTGWTSTKYSDFSQACEVLRRLVSIQAHSKCLYLQRVGVQGNEIVHIRWFADDELIPLEQAKMKLL